MKTAIEPVEKRRAGLPPKWIPGGVPDAGITKEQAERFTASFTAIADQITGLPADFARNHDPKNGS